MIQALSMIALAATGQAEAAQIALTRQELCAHSERVVIAEVTDIETRWASRGRIERRVHLAVERTIAGPSRDDVDLVLPGGTIGDLQFIVEHSPTLLVDATYLLFVSERGDVVGGEQGAIRITPPGAHVGESLETALESLEDCRAK